MARQQLTRDDWIRAALDAITRGGIAAVRVDVLAKELGITRGSFYWHFADRDALLGAALERWERTVTDEIIERLGRIDSPVERFAEIFRIAFFGSRDRNRVEPALAADADHPVVAPVLRRATAARIAFLTDLSADLGLDQAEARQRALITYSTFVGWLQLRRSLPDVVPETTDETSAAEPFREYLNGMFLPDAARRLT
jgi:AcrR family transcriptional regulator